MTSSTTNKCITAAICVTVLGVALTIAFVSSLQSRHDHAVKSTFDIRCKSAGGHVLHAQTGGGSDNYCIYGLVRIVFER